jgi:hypothetical protein
MKRLLSALSVAVAALMLFAHAGPALAADAAAAPAEGATASEAPAHEQYVRRGRRGVPHYRSGRVYRYQPRVHYRSYPVYRPAPRVYYGPRVVVAPAPVVVQPRPVYVQERVVAAPAPAPVVYEAPPAIVEDDEEFASIHFRFVSLNESDTDLAFETVQGANLLGVGAGLRFAVDPHWVVELGLDFLAGEEDDADQIAVPLSVSALARLFPDSVIDPYGIAGLGIMFSEFDDPDYAEVEQYSQFFGHVGGGVEINAGPILITSDLRLALMQTRPERDEPLGAGGSGGGVSVRGDGDVVTVTEQDPDDMSTALQFTIGAGWRF